MRLFQGLSGQRSARPRVKARQQHCENATQEYAIKSPGAADLSIGNDVEVLRLARSHRPGSAVPFVVVPRLACDMQPPVDPDLEHLGVGLKATMAIAGREATAGRSSAEKSESFEVATATLAGL
jgi:hypothetical protein